MKKLLASLLATALVLGLLPTWILAATAQLLIAPTYTYNRVYPFDDQGSAQVWGHDRIVSNVTLTEGKLTAQATPMYYSFYDPELRAYGYEDAEGKMVLPAQYEWIAQTTVPTTQGFFWVMLNQEWVAVSTDGTERTDRYGSAEGIWDVDHTIPDYENVVVTVGHNQGLLHTATNQMIIPTDYYNLSPDYLPDGTLVFWGSDYSTHTCFTADGTPLFTLDATEIPILYSRFNGAPYLIADIPEGHAIIDTTGKVCFSTDCYVYYVGAHRFSLQQPGGLALCDAQGNVLCDGSYYSIAQFEGDYARVQQKNQENWYPYGLIDRQGTVVVPPRYAWVCATSNGYFGLTDTDYNSQVVDTRGNVVIPPFSGNLRVMMGADCFQATPLYDPNSVNVTALLIPGVDTQPNFQYSFIDKFMNGIAVVTQVEGDNIHHYGLVDTTGAQILPCIYDAVVPSADSDYVWVGAIDGTVYLPNWGTIDSYDYGVVKLDRTATTPVATPTSYPVLVDGQPVAFDVYAMKDANGNDTNYFKLRDMASVLNGTSCQFNVGWDGAVNLTLGEAYVPNGTEMSAPFTGPQTVNDADAKTNVNGAATPLDTITLTDANGNGYTYYQLRALGDAVGFTVDWSADAGIMINTK